MIRVLLVEDSPVQAELVRRRLAQEPDIELILWVQSGEECIQRAPILRPNLVIMDANLPGISGPQVTARLLEVYPVPIILFTDSPETFQKLGEDSGVVATVPKNSEDFSSLDMLIRSIRVMNGMKIIRKIPLRAQKSVRKRYLLIASSSGGPGVVEHILKGVPPSSGLIVILVQHLSESGTLSFKRWLEKATKWPVTICEDQEALKQGHVYLGPAGFKLEWHNDKMRLGERRDRTQLAPSADNLFMSFAKANATEIIALVLSGMGRDGATGLLHLRLAGATTMVQDPSNAAVCGMPEAAIASGAALHIFSEKDFVTGIKSYL